MLAYAKTNNIAVHPRWKDFPAFELDVGCKPSNLDHQLRRLDISQGFEPGNVVWLKLDRVPTNERPVIASPEMSATDTISFYAETLNLSPRTVQRRLSRGWTLQELQSTPRGRKPARQQAAPAVAQDILTKLLQERAQIQQRAKEVERELAQAVLVDIPKPAPAPQPTQESKPKPYVDTRPDTQFDIDTRAKKKADAERMLGGGELDIQF